MSIGHRAPENPSAECPRTFIPGDGCPETRVAQKNAFLKKTRAPLVFCSFYWYTYHTDFFSEF